MHYFIFIPLSSPLTWVIFISSHYKWGDRGTQIQSHVHVLWAERGVRVQTDCLPAELGLLTLGCQLQFPEKFYKHDLILPTQKSCYMGIWSILQVKFRIALPEITQLVRVYGRTQAKTSDIRFNAFSDTPKCHLPLVPTWQSTQQWHVDSILKINCSLDFYN